jgi:hypothetical protein
MLSMYCSWRWSRLATVLCVAVVNAMLSSSAPTSFCHHFQFCSLSSFRTGSSPIDLSLLHSTLLSTACSKADHSDIALGWMEGSSRASSPSLNLAIRCKILDSDVTLWTILSDFPLFHIRSFDSWLIHIREDAMQDLRPSWRTSQYLYLLLSLNRCDMLWSVTRCSPKRSLLFLTSHGDSFSIFGDGGDSQSSCFVSNDVVTNYFFLVNSSQFLLFGLFLLAVAPTALRWSSSLAPSIVVAIVKSRNRRSVKSGCFTIKVKEEKVGGRTSSAHNCWYHRHLFWVRFRSTRWK